MRGPRGRARAAAPRLFTLAGIAVASVGVYFASDLTAGASKSSDWRWELPKGFPKPRVPANNKMSDAKVAVGHRLFFDRRLSGNATQSCSSCHRPELAFTDGLAQAVGSTGEVHPRNAQSLINVVYDSTLTWANPALVTLERQMEVPLFGTDPVEMGVTDASKDRVLNRIKRDRWYAKRFRRAFPGRKLTWTAVIRSIAAYQRSLINGGLALRPLPARQDQADALRDARHGPVHGREGRVPPLPRIVHLQRPGHLRRRAGRAAAVPQHRALQPRRDRRLPRAQPRGLRPERQARGHGEVQGPIATQRGADRPVHARRLDRELVEAAIEHYAAGGRNITEGPLAGDGRANPYKDPLVSGIDLTSQDKADLVAFLQSLTDLRLNRDPRFKDPFR